MQVEQRVWTPDQGWRQLTRPDPLASAQLALVFGSKTALSSAALLAEVRARHPAARLLGCSTAGEIGDTRVLDDSLVVTAVHFERTALYGAVARLEQPDGYDAGAYLAAALPSEGLAHVFVLSDGHHVNGTRLVAGLTAGLPAGVRITGGLAGDGERFGETLVLWDQPLERTVAAVGLYGPALRVGHGSLGGWDPFGPERLVTRSVGNVLYELDGRSALGLYKQYLGEQAVGLPATALLFPLSLRMVDGESVVRTVLSIDEESQSMTFAGDLPQGSFARLMKANFDRLIDGAAGAARSSQLPLGGGAPDLAILISCVGRKMLLGQRVEEEVESVREVLGPRPVVTGFYSYGEISPLTTSGRCELHNQTMTITTFAET